MLIMVNISRVSSNILQDGISLSLDIHKRTKYEISAILSNIITPRIKNLEIHFAKFYVQLPSYL